MTASTTAATAIKSITPYIAVRKAEEVMDFIRQAFGAVGEVQGTGSQGGLHAEFTLDGSKLMIGGGKNWNAEQPERPAALHYYVREVDAVYARAVEAGATSLQAPIDQPYGDREAAVRDVAGNRWYLATNQATGHMPAGMPNLMAFLHARRSRELIRFLEAAFGASDPQVFEQEGRVAHAAVRLGSSMLEMSDAHGEWQPMPTTFFCNVDDVDAAYERALAAGGASMVAPADAAFGARLAGVTDLEGNQWYLAAPVRR